MCISKEQLIKKYKTIDEKTKHEKQKILKLLKEKGMLTVEDNIVKESNLCIILSCPGEQELISNKVCSGETGDNLEKILRKLINKIGHDKIIGKVHDKQSPIRYNYNIINSCDEVHFRSYNRAEPTKESIKKPENVNRIIGELNCENIQYFIICGHCAETLFDLIKYKFKNAYKKAIVCHLGWVGLRNEYKNNHEDLKDINDADSRDEKRIDLVVEFIEKEWKKNF